MKLPFIAWIFAFVFIYKCTNQVYIAKCDDTQFHDVLIYKLNQQIKQRLTQPPYSLTSQQIHAHDTLINKLGVAPFRPATVQAATKDAPTAQCTATWRFFPDKPTQTQLETAIDQQANTNLESVLSRYQWDTSKRMFPATPFTLNANFDDILDAVQLPENKQLVDSLAEVVFYTIQNTTKQDTKPTKNLPAASSPIPSPYQREIHALKRKLIDLNQQVNTTTHQLTPQQLADWTSFDQVLTTHFQFCDRIGKQATNAEQGELIEHQCKIAHQTKRVMMIQVVAEPSSTPANVLSPAQRGVAQQFAQIPYETMYQKVFQLSPKKRAQWDKLETKMQQQQLPYCLQSGKKSKAKQYDCLLEIEQIHRHFLGV